MSDMKVRPVKIVLDKPRNLIFDLNAFEELENIYADEPAIFKTTIDDGAEVKTEVLNLTSKAFQYLADDKRKIRHIKNFLFAGLVHEDDSLTPRKVGTMIGWNNVDAMASKIWEAIGGSLPEPKEDAGDKPGE